MFENKLSKTKHIEEGKKTDSIFSADEMFDFLRIYSTD